MKGDIIRKIFGCGPDGYSLYVQNFFREELAAKWGSSEILACAHNEWLNAVINYGIYGAAAYIGIFITAIVNFAKEQVKQPVMAGMIACVVSYMCHNFFCYQQVCCTPFIFLIMGAGMYLVRKSGREVKA